MAFQRWKNSKMFPVLIKLFSTTCGSSSNTSANREARMLAKMFASKEDRKMWLAGPRTNISKTFNMVSKRRATVLNKLYMTSISEVMMYGDVSDLLAGKSVGISRVKVMDNLQQVNVYWVSNESEPEHEVQKLLDKVSGIIQKELSVTKVMGTVPRVKFVRDVGVMSIAKTDQLLRQLQLKNEESEDPAHLEKGWDISSLPPMATDTLGLNYSNILNKIQTAKAKSYPMTIPEPIKTSRFPAKISACKTEKISKKEIEMMVKDFRRSTFSMQGRKLYLAERQHHSSLDVNGNDDFQHDEDEDYYAYRGEDDSEEDKFDSDHTKTQ